MPDSERRRKQRDIAVKTVQQLIPNARKKEPSGSEVAYEIVRSIFSEVPEGAFAKGRSRPDQTKK